MIVQTQDNWWVSHESICCTKWWPLYNVISRDTRGESEWGKTDKCPSSKLQCQLTVFITTQPGLVLDTRMLSEWHPFFALSSSVCVSAPLMCYSLNAKKNCLSLCEQGQRISSSWPNDELCFSWQCEGFLFSPTHLFLQTVSVEVFRPTDERVWLFFFFFFILK